MSANAAFRKMRQSLAGIFDVCAPAMAVTGPVYVNVVDAPFEIEPEFTIGELHLRHNEIKSVDRPNLLCHSED